MDQHTVRKPWLGGVGDTRERQRKHDGVLPDAKHFISNLIQNIIRTGYFAYSSTSSYVEWNAWRLTNGVTT